MKTLPHIDIIEPERIAALLADERNFCWRAVDSEGLDGWTPDIGISGYPRPSAVRPASVAAAGVPSTLRQRFWQTVQNQADHTGPRYIGVVIYLQAGEPSPLILRLRGQDIGRIEPQRLDNRLHLLVADQPVDFIGEMEIFNLIAPGPGSYRIEHVLLLSERPEPSSFAPEIRNLSWRVEAGANGSRSANLQFLTSRVAAVEAHLSAADGQQVTTQCGAASRLHHLVIPDLQADAEYSAEIIARDPAGESASERLSFSTRDPQPVAGQALSVPLELINPRDCDLTGLPLTFGLPFEQGAAHQVDSCSLEAGDQLLPARARGVSRWSDGSLRWALVDSRVPAGLSQGSTISAIAHINGIEAPRPQSSIANINGSGAPTPQSSRVSLGGGGLTIEAPDRRSLSLADWRFKSVLANGLTLSAGPVHAIQQEASGAFRFEVDHQDADGIAHLRSTMRLQFFPDQTFVKFHHRLEVISPALSAAAAGGDIPPECADEMRANIVGDSGEESTLLKLRSFSLRIPLKRGARAVHHGEQFYPLDGEGWQLRHDHDLAHTINGDEREGRALGHIRVEGDSKSLGVGLRQFWQTYPKALSVDRDGIDIHLFPDRRGIDLPGDDEAWHRLYFWLDDDGYKLKAGMALSSEILLDFGADPTAAFDWLEGGILVRPDIDYLNASGALNAIGARKDSVLPRYEELADIAMRSFFDDQEHYRAYGHINYGDWYGESAWSWGNNEYDPAYVGYSEFLRGGEPGWALWAADAARHLADVDTINFSRQPAEIGGQAMHIPGHLGGYLPPYFRSKMKGTSLGPAHMWVEGQLLHYLLSGDQAVYDSLLKTKDWLIQRERLDYYDYKSARDSGWHLIHLSMLALVLDDPDCLNAASIIVERVLERRTPGGGWDRMLGEPHCGCGYPRCSGEAGFMICVLISGLKRYHHLTGDQAVAEAIIGGARWLINETFDHESGYFRYTSCPNRSLGGTFQCTQWALEALAAAWELSGDPEIGAYLKRGLPVIGQYPARLSHLGLGKAMSQQMRYVPTILASLAKRPLEEIDGGT